MLTLTSCPAVPLKVYLAFWPMAFGPRLLDGVQLSADDREKIEHINAARVFGIQVSQQEAH